MIFECDRKLRAAYSLLIREISDKYLMIRKEDDVVIDCTVKTNRRTVCQTSVPLVRLEPAGYSQEQRPMLKSVHDIVKSHNNLFVLIAYFTTNK